MTPDNEWALADIRFACKQAGAEVVWMAKPTAIPTPGEVKLAGEIVYGHVLEVLCRIYGLPKPEEQPPESVEKTT